MSDWELGVGIADLSQMLSSTTGPTQAQTDPVAGQAVRLRQSYGKKWFWVEREKEQE